jgi:hypothetical protein
MYLTEREHSLFRDMFNLPAESMKEGVDDTHPIVLPDSADQFRSLCWLLYAL